MWNKEFRRKKKRLAQLGEEEKENFRRSGTELQTSSASGLIKISAAAAQVKWLLIFDFFSFFLMDFGQTAVKDWGRAVSSDSVTFIEETVG